MKKKKIIIIVILLILMVFGITWKIIYDVNKEKNYYQNLKDNIQEDIERILRITHPYCSVGENGFSLILEEKQNNYYGVDKKKLLDIDGKSYCKIRAKVKCVSENKLEWDTYIKCKDYEDGFDYNIEEDF